MLPLSPQWVRLWLLVPPEPMPLNQSRCLFVPPDFESWLLAPPLGLRTFCWPALHMPPSFPKLPILSALPHKTMEPLWALPQKALELPQVLLAVRRLALLRQALLRNLLPRTDLAVPFPHSVLLAERAWRECGRWLRGREWPRQWSLFRLGFAAA